MTGPWCDRTVTGHIPLSLDGRVTGPGGEHDMGWTVRHVTCGEVRAQLLTVTGTATTALLGRRTYQGFGGFWPAVAGDENADPRDRAFARWLDEVEKVVVSRTLTEAGCAIPGSWPTIPPRSSGTFVSVRAGTCRAGQRRRHPPPAQRPASSTG